MPIGIRTNQAALAAQNVLRLNALFLLTNSEQLSSGKRLVRSSIDPSALSLSQRFRSRISGTDAAIQNSQDSISLLQTAESGLSSINDLVARNRDLAVRAANSATLTPQQQQILDDEFQANLQAIDQIANGNRFNTKNLNEGTFGTQQSQVGPEANDTLDVALNDAQSVALGLAGQTLVGPGAAQAAITAADSAIQSLGSQRANIGITERRLQSAVNTLNTDYIAQSEANSRIADTDFTKAITERTLGLLQNRFGLAALAAANANPLSALSLLRSAGVA